MGAIFSSPCIHGGKKGNVGKKVPNPKTPPKNVASATALVIGVNYDNYPALYDPAEGAYANIKANVGLAQQFGDLCKQSGMKVEMLVDGPSSNASNYPTRANVLQKIAEIGKTLGGEDMFVLYFAGLGAKVFDHSGEEFDGTDEGLCLPDPTGNIYTGTNILIDDELQDALASNINHDCRMIVLLDTDYGQDMLDFGAGESIAGHEVVLITANQDYPLTQSLIEKVNYLDAKRTALYSIGDVWNKMVKEGCANELSDFLCLQMTMELASQGDSFWSMAWPISPKFKGQGLS